MPGRARFAGLFARNGLVISLIAALSVAAFIFGFAAVNDPAVLYGVHTGPGAFYKLMPHNAMAVLFGAAFLYAIAGARHERARVLARHRRARRHAAPMPARSGRRSAMPASCAISTAAASAASTKTSSRPTAASSTII